HHTPRDPRQRSRHDLDARSRALEAVGDRTARGQWQGQPSDAQGPEHDPVCCPAMAVPPEIEQRAGDLRAEIGEHNRRYHVEDDPIIADADFDGLVGELRALETEFPELITPHSPTQLVGGPASVQFSEVKHRVPMMSLDNAFTFDELLEWGKRLERRLGSEGQAVGYVCELKIDGFAVSLTY